MNPDRAYVINTTTYMTTDAGKTWVPVKGAPGGDDYHQIWINPKDGNRMVLSSDQGTVVSVDGAQDLEHLVQPAHRRRSTTSPPTIASPTGSTARSRIPAASASAPGRAQGVLSFRNWEPTCLAGESDIVVPDPKDGNILYGDGAGRCDQNLNIAASLGGALPAPDPNDPNRKTWTLPQVFSPSR